MAHGFLMDTLRSGVNGCQGVVDRRRLSLTVEFVIRMAEFKSVEAKTNFAEASDFSPRGELNPLVMGKVKEAEAQCSRCILDVDEIASTASQAFFKGEDRAFDQ